MASVRRKPDGVFPGVAKPPGLRWTLAVTGLSHGDDDESSGLGWNGTDFRKVTRSVSKGFCWFL